MAERPELNPQMREMADESMVRTLAAQAQAIWPQEALLLARYALPERPRILDAGCGTGEIAARLATRYPEAQVLGVDVLDVNLAVARRHESVRLHFENRSVYDLGLADASFDLTVCRHVIHSIPHPDRVLKELVRVTTPGGYLHVIAEDYGMLHFTPGSSVDPDDFWREGPKAFGKATGTDLHVGRKGFSLFRAAGLIDISVSYVTVDTDRVPRPIFAAIMEAWRDGYVEAVAEHTRFSPTEVAAHFEASIAAIRDPEGYAVWFVPGHRRTASGVKRWGVLVALTLGVAVVTLLLADPPPPRKVVLATGDVAGAYHEFGGELARGIARHHGVPIELRSTEGSVENLRLLAAGKVDVAFVQGGVVSALQGQIDLTSVVGIARVYSEPLWVFYRADRELTQLRELSGRRLAIGRDGSGTQLITRELLHLHGVPEANLLRLGDTEALAALESGEVDALFLVASPKADVVKTLLRLPGVRLLSFTNYRAYLRRLPYLSSLDLEPGVVSLEENLPAQAVVLLAPSATLLTRDDMDPRVVESFTKGSMKLFSRAGGNTLDAEGAFPSALGLEVPQHDAAKRFMTEGESWTSRHLPYWLVRLLSRLQLLIIPLLTVLVPGLKIAPWLLRLRVKRLVQKHYVRLNRSEQALRAATTPEEITAQLALIDAQKEELAVRARKLAGRDQDVIYDWKLHAELVERAARHLLER